MFNDSSGVMSYHRKPCISKYFWTMAQRFLKQQCYRCCVVQTSILGTPLEVQLIQRKVYGFPYLKQLSHTNAVEIT